MGKKWGVMALVTAELCGGCATFMPQQGGVGSVTTPLGRFSTNVICGVNPGQASLLQLVNKADTNMTRKTYVIMKKADGSVHVSQESDYYSEKYFGFVQFYGPMGSSNADITPTKVNGQIVWKTQVNDVMQSTNIESRVNSSSLMPEDKADFNREAAEIWGAYKYTEETCPRLLHSDYATSMSLPNGEVIAQVSGDLYRVTWGSIDQLTGSAQVHLDLFSGTITLAYANTRYEYNPSTGITNQDLPGNHKSYYDRPMAPDVVPVYNKAMAAWDISARFFKRQYNSYYNVSSHGIKESFVGQPLVPQFGVGVAFPLPLR